MTENEIKNTKEWFKDFIETYALSNQETIEFQKAVACLEEIQQYRAIGTVEELKSLKESNLTALEMADIWCLLEDLKKYSAIGTIDEFKALKKNQRKCEDCAGCTTWKCDCENIRAKAIEEFAERLKYEHKQTITTESVYISRIFDEVVDEIAEQMKGGAE